MGDEPWMASDRTRGQREIIEATFRVLRTHGLSGLSIGRIAADLGQSKATIYSHYRGRDALVHDTLVAAAGRLARRLDSFDDGDPAAELSATVDLLLASEPSVEPATVAAREVLVELRGEAAVDEGFREVFSAFDEHLHHHVTRCLRAGTETAAFDVADPPVVAEHVVATLGGALVASVSTDREVVPRVRAGLCEQLELAQLGASR
jgi:AcrR family transcriptional regulator